MQQERVDYWQEVKDVDPENFIFIDESAVWEGMERSVARSPKGHKAFCLRAAYKGQKHTLIGAIAIKGLVCIKTMKGSMKRLSRKMCKSYKLYVETLLEEDGKSIKCRFPIANGHSPLLRDIPHCQVNQFESSLVRRENLLRFNHFPQTAIH